MYYNRQHKYLIDFEIPPSYYRPLNNEDLLKNMDISIIEKFLRKKKLETINNIKNK